MHFHFCNVNHTCVGRLTLLDMQDWIRAGLEELGHRVSSSATEVDPSAINIFWEDFSPDFVQQLRSLNIVYGIFATEVADGEGFNHRREPEWLERYRCFPEVASRAKFIWTTVESSVEFYQQFAPSAFVEFGFSSKLLKKDSETPDFDFSFFGLRTPHRDAVIERLKKAGCKVVWPQYLLDQKELFELIDRSKVGLSFRQNGLWPIPSPTRLGRYMHAKRVIACEWTPQHTRQSQILRHPNEKDDLVDFVYSLLHSDWKGEALRVFEEYRARLPMRQVMEEVLDRTLSGQSAQAAQNTVLQAVPFEMLSKPTPYLVEVVAGHNIIQSGNDYYSLERGCDSTMIEQKKPHSKLTAWKTSKAKNLATLKQKICRRGRFIPYSPALVREDDRIEVWDMDTYFVGIESKARHGCKEASIEIWQGLAKRAGCFFYCTRDRSRLELEIAQYLAKGS